jgi:hypothetical protein
VRHAHNEMWQSLLRPEAFCEVRRESSPPRRPQSLQARGNRSRDSSPVCQAVAAQLSAREGRMRNSSPHRSSSCNYSTMIAQSGQQALKDCVPHASQASCMSAKQRSRSHTAMCSHADARESSGPPQACQVSSSSRGSLSSPIAGSSPAKGIRATMPAQPSVDRHDKLADFQDHCTFKALLSQAILAEELLQWSSPRH